MTLEERIYELDRRFGELIQKSPKTPAEMQEKERIRDALEGALRQEVKPLTDEMSQVGINADVWDLC